MKSGPRNAVVLAALALLPPLGAALVGTGRVREVRLDLGPGDGPFTAGFSSPRPESFDPYEIKDGVSTHWTTHEARLNLPLAVDAPAVGLALRLARHFSDRGSLQVQLPGSQAESFAVMKGYETYETTVAVSRPAPLDLALHVRAGGEDRGLGVSLDWVRFDLPSTNRLRLTGTARFRAVVLTGLVLVVLWAAGLTTARAAAIAVVPGLAFSGGLLFDPWLLYRLLRGLPETVALLVPLVLVARFALDRRAVAGEGRPAGRAFRGGLVLFLALALPRAILVNHPGYYYPDLMIHARIAKLMAREGMASVSRPEVFLGRFQEARHSVGGFPYSLAFHAPLAVWDPPYDTALCALRVGGAFLSALPVLMGLQLLRQLRPSMFGAVLLAVAPTYPYWLFHATLPALLGHVFDLALLSWFATHLEDLGRARSLAAGALLVAMAQLAYAFSLPVTALFVAFLALFLALRGDGGPALAARVLVAGVAGASLSLAAYYRHFVPGAWAAARAGAAQGAAGASSGPDATTGALSALPRLLDGTRFFDTAWPLLALVGLLLLWRDPRSVVLRAFVATGISLVAVRTLLPGVFRWNHEMLFLTPLLSLLAGEALGRLSTRGLWARRLAWLVLGVIAAQSLSLTASSFLEEVRGAR